MGGYNHTIKLLFWKTYRICWTVDYEYPDSMRRYPRRFSRDTDKLGAERFAKKHGAKMPVPTPQQPQPRKETP